ncbi:MAG TPA: HAD family hydrolase [Gaiellaceae bacterium]|nr:HAD family hydrolase [Gaiellaceae bacterium]
MDDVLAFDVNETLLDLRALDEVSRARSVIRHCATRVVSADAPRLAFVGGLTGAYVDFTTAQRAALRMLAARTGKRLADHEQEEIVVGMRRLPPHPNVRAGLPALREAGVRQVTLTNSPLDVVRDQLEFAGLLDLFDDVLSADEVKELKPGPKPYRLVADRHGVAISGVRLVAAHAWDVSGAPRRRRQGGVRGPSRDGPEPARRAAGYHRRRPSPARGALS